MFSWKKAGSLAALFCAVALWFSCGDTYRPIAIPIVTPGGIPQSIHYAYALYTNPLGTGNGTPGPGTLQQIDVSGDSVTLQVIVGRNPLFAAFLGTSTGEIFTANEADGTVTEQSFLDAQPPSVITLPPTVAPVAIGGTNSAEIYVVDATAPSECSGGVGALNVLTVGNVVTDTVCVGLNPVYVAQQPNNGKVYVVNQGGNTVSVVDPVSHVVIATIPVGTGPVWAVSNLDGSYIFVVNKGSGTITAIKAVNNTTTTFTSGTGASSAPNFAVFDSRRNRLYVTNGGDNTVTVFDLSQATPQILKQTVGLGTGAVNPTSVVPLADGSRYYVANTTSNSVSVLDANSNTLSKTATTNPIPLGTASSTSQPLWIETEPTSTKVYVTTPAPVGAPPSYNPNGAPGVTIFRTDTNGVESFVQAPQSDPNCQVNPQTGATCTYQTPIQLLTYVHD